MIHYPVPPHRQSAYNEFIKTELPVSEKIHREVLSLPMDILNDIRAYKYISKQINRFLENV